MNIYVIIPAYNENETVLMVVNSILQSGYEIILIDDGSDTPLIGELQNLPIHYIRHCMNLGQGAAIQTGIEYALDLDAEYIITFDADGQHQASDIEKLIIPLKKGGFDVTLGSRFLETANLHMPKGKELLLQLARGFNFITTGIFLSDAHNGLRAVSRKAASVIQIRQNGMAHATEILHIIKKQKLRYKEVAVDVLYTDYSLQKGQSIWNSFRIVFDLFLNKIFK